MPRTISKRDTIVNDNLSSWDKAIADAKRGIARLEAVIQDCLAKKAAGEPWPGTEETQSATRN